MHAHGARLSPQSKVHARRANATHVREQRCGWGRGRAAKRTRIVFEPAARQPKRAPDQLYPREAVSAQRAQRRTSRRRAAPRPRGGGSGLPLARASRKRVSARVRPSSAKPVVGAARAGTAAAACAVRGEGALAAPPLCASTRGNTLGATRRSKGDQSVAEGIVDRLGKQRFKCPSLGREAATWTGPSKCNSSRTVLEIPACWSPKPPRSKAVAQWWPCKTCLIELYTHGRNSLTLRSPSVLLSRASW